MIGLIAMSIENLKKRALEVRSKYAQNELKKYGKQWSRQDIVLGFIGDVGDLAKLAIAQEGRRDIADFKEKTAHELADCLWSILVLSDEYNINLEESFLDLCDTLEVKISTQLTNQK